MVKNAESFKFLFDIGTFSTSLILRLRYLGSILLVFSVVTKKIEYIYFFVV